MSPLTKKPTEWRLRRPDPAAVDALVRSKRLHPALASILVARGIDDSERAQAHLEPKLSALHDPARLPDMQLATTRIARAIADKETILVHGDYDVDGVTGTALLMRLFERLGAKARWHIPNRFTDGYSFGDHSVERARETGATLVISVDNGTSSLETITKLKANGVDTIVTDHHEPPLGELPPAVAIVNPKLDRGDYPFRELCGGAVAFKLAWGVCQELSGASRVREDLKEYLVESMGLVAIATVADVVPLIDENRVLARHGLRSLEMTKHHGIRALLEVAKIAGARLLSEDVAFKLAPRINASGRLGSAKKAVELFLARDEATARSLAQELDQMNVERKRIEGEILADALIEADRYTDADRWPVLVLAKQGWHQGVVGIIAARLAERFERPAVVIGLAGDRGRGSARSIENFSVLDALHGAAEHFERYGGHEQAAGCEVRADRVEAAREAICARAREMFAARPSFVREVHIDAEIPFEHVTPTFMKDFERLEPFGERNEKPILAAHDMRLAEAPRALGADRTHLMVQWRHGANVLKGMAFGQAHRIAELVPGTPYQVLFTPKWNAFRGQTNLELELVDFRAGRTALA